MFKSNNSFSSIALTASIFNIVLWEKQWRSIVVQPYQHMLTHDQTQKQLIDTDHSKSVRILHSIKEASRMWSLLQPGRYFWMTLHRVTRAGAGMMVLLQFMETARRVWLITWHTTLLHKHGWCLRSCLYSPHPIQTIIYWSLKYV